MRPLVPSSWMTLASRRSRWSIIAVDGLLVAGDDARAEQDGVAGVDLGELVVVDRGAGERGHGLALGAGDHEQSLFGGHVADLAGVDDQALREIEVAEVLRDLGGVVDASGR